MNESNEKDDKILRKETLEKEEQVYREAMATYRHFHGYIATAFLVIGAILGAGIVFRWVGKFWGNGYYIAIIALVAVTLFLILSILITYLFIYAKISRMKVLEVACKIEESWFPDEKDKEKCLAHTLMEETEKKGPLCWIIKKLPKRFVNQSLIKKLMDQQS